MEICWFYANLVCNGAITIQSSVRQGRKHGVQGANAVNITIYDSFVHLSAILGAFTQY